MENMAEKQVLLTGDRPTGKLHIGHYVGSLKNRVAMQNSGDYEPFIMIADKQAFTDNARDPQLIVGSCFGLPSCRYRPKQVNDFRAISCA